MQAGMNPHVGVTPRPINGGDDSRTLTQRRYIGIVCGYVNHGTIVFPASCIRDRDRRTVCQAQCAGITRLPAAHRIKHSPVKHDPALADLKHLRITLLAVSIFIKHQFSHVVAARSCFALLAVAPGLETAQLDTGKIHPVCNCRLNAGRAWRRHAFSASRLPPARALSPKTSRV